MNIIKLTRVDDDVAVYINADNITHVVDYWDGTNVYVVGKKKPLYVNEGVDSVVKALLYLDRKDKDEIQHT